MDLILQKPPVNKSLKRSLIAFWKLGEAGGTRYSSKTPGIGPAAQFTAANSESLSRADNADLSMGAGVRFNIGGWVYLDTVTADIYDFMGKWKGGTPNNYEYWLGYRGSSGSPASRLELAVTSDGELATMATVNANTFGALSASTWYYVEAGYDGTNIYISVNDGTRDTTAFSADVFNGTSAFVLGDRDNSAGRFFNGRMQSMFLYKKSLSAAEVTSLYNSGSGMAYRGLSGSLLTSLTSWWNLNEVAGTRFDETSSNNDLTDNNTVTQAIGVAGGNSLGEANTVTQAVGKIGNAGQFTAANSEYLATPDNTDLSVGDIDFTLSAWVYLDSLTGSQVVISKEDSGTVREYLLWYNTTDNRFQINAFNSSGTSIGMVQASTFGDLSTGTWYFVIAYHDATNNQVGISVNNGTVDTAATTGVPSDTTAGFKIGADLSTPAAFWDGRIDAVGFWKRILTTAERTKLYRGGLGREFPF